MRSCVVLGCGRSGTSMVAGSLRAAGYNMGARLLPPSPSNPKGYFEDRNVNELNEDLLLGVAPLKPSGRRRFVYPRRLPYGYRWLAVVDPGKRPRVTPELARRVPELIPPWPFCLKDPRFCYTLDVWRPALGDAAFICVFREPDRTAESVRAAVSREPEYLGAIRPSRRRALAVWTTMYRHILERHRHRGDWQFVHYEQVLDGTALPRLEALLGAPLDAQFADRALSRSAHAGAVPAKTALLYRRLCALAQFSQTPCRPSRGAIGRRAGSVRSG